MLCHSDIDEGLYQNATDIEHTVVAIVTLGEPNESGTKRRNRSKQKSPLLKLDSLYVNRSRLLCDSNLLFSGGTYKRLIQAWRTTLLI